MQFRWDLQNGMHKNDEQSQVAGRESALIVTSLECHKGVNSPLPKSPAPVRRGMETNIFDSGPTCIVHSTSYMLFQPWSWRWYQL